MRNLNQKYPRGVLFDLDDTILSINARVEQVWRKVSEDFTARHIGIQLENLIAAIAEMKEWYWSDMERHQRGRLNLARARREIIELALSRLGFANIETAGELAQAYGEELEKHMQPFPGAIETLKHFRGNNIMLALVTNGAAEVQRKKINRFGLEPLFDCIVIESEFGVGKPDRRVFEHALERIGVGTGESWMIGDDLARDVAGAQQLGIHSVWVDWQGKGLPAAAPARPDRVISRIAELV